MQEEIWKSVVGYEGIYEISDFGNMRSVDRFGLDGRKLQGRPLSPVLQSTGYFTFDLCGKKRMKPTGVHRIVAEAFMGRIPEKMVIDHLDGNPQNNHVSNLEIVTVRENTVRGRGCQMSKSKYTGVHQRGKNWAAFKSINGVRQYLGTYEKESDAHEAYMEGKKTSAAIISPKGYSFCKGKNKFQIDVLGKYYGYVETEKEAIERVSKIRKGLQSTMTEQ